MMASEADCGTTAAARDGATRIYVNRNLLPETLPLIKQLQGSLQLDGLGKTIVAISTTRTKTTSTPKLRCHLDLCR